MQFQKASEGKGRLRATGFGPNDEFGDIHPSVASLAVMHPTLRFLQALAKLPLGEARFFPQCAQQLEQASIGPGMLRFGAHAGR